MNAILGTYVGVTPTEKTECLLKEWAEQNNLTLDTGLHVTLLYSRVEIQIEPEHYSYFKAEPLELCSLGDAALVLKIKSNSLQMRHDKLMDLGATHDYPEYNPHLTLMYKGIVPRKLTPITFDLFFNSEYVEDLDLDR